MKKFIIEYTENIGQQQLLYLEDECSFYMDYSNQSIDIELIINKIALQVSNNEIVDLSGFCGLSKEMRANLQVPNSKKGVLKVKHNLEYGFAYNVNDDYEYEYPVYVSVATGWVCIGNPEKKGNAVEFINSCIAVINDNGDFESLWLNPKSLPKSLF